MVVLLINLITTSNFVYSAGQQEKDTPLSKRKFPQEIGVATATMVSASTVMLMSMVPEFEKRLGTKLRAVPSDILLTQCLATKIGKAGFWNTTLGSAYRPAFGVEEYCVKDWGPQRIRMAWMGGPQLLSLMVRAKSNIQSMEDLRGKKIGVYAGGEGFVSACLAHGDLTLKDVKVVPATGYAGAITMLSENKVDSAFADVTSPICYELAQTPGGLRFLPLPHNNKAGWKRVQKIYPALMPYTVPDGMGVKPAWNQELLGFPRAYFTFAKQDPIISYGVAKVCDEGYEFFKDAHVELKKWTFKTAIDCLNAPLPYHEGAIEYFKGKGAWTKAHESWQRKVVEYENLRVEAWPIAIKEAMNKGIKIDKKNQEWIALWKSYLNKIYQ